MIENNKLYILPKASEKFIKFVNVGDPEILEITDKGARIDDTMKFEYQQSFWCCFGCHSVHGSD